MSTSVLENELRTEMSAVGVDLSPEMLSKCVALARNQNFTPSEMATAWETHSLNSNTTLLNSFTFKSFRTTLTSSKSRKKKTNNDTTVSPALVPKKRGAVINRPAMGKRSHPSDPSTPRGVKRRVDFNDENNKNDLNSSPLTTSKAPKTMSTFSPSTATSNSINSSSSAIVTPSKKKTDVDNIQKNAYANRTTAGDIVTCFNPNNLEPITSVSPNQKVEISEPYGSVKKYKHMTDLDRSSALNSHLNSFQKEILEQLKGRMTDDDDGDEIVEFVGVPRQAKQVNVGRICNEAHEGRMNKTTILLEGSKEGSNGARITLDISKLSKSFSCFPGQIVGVKGVNSSGRKMIVEEFIEGIETQVVKSKKEELRRIYNETSNNDNGTRIFAVSGPYTTNQNLNYEPLADLLNMVIHDKPAVVIMMGPFIDLRQQLLKDGDQVVLEYEDESKEGGIMKRHVSFETLFAAKISQELEGLYEEFPDLNTKFILVPSLDDAVSEPVFPQPPIEDSFPDGGKVMNEIEITEDFPFGSLCLDIIETAGGRKMPKHISDRRVHLVSNPSTIKINEVTIGMTSTDALMHLSTEEINQRLPPGTRVRRLAEHFIQQQSYYPIFPAPSLPGMRVNLDVNKRSGYRMPVQPDILLLPSRLTCLVKDITGGTVVVNPGHLVKGASGGSFAVMDIHPIKKDKLEDINQEEVANNLKNRLRVEIRKI